MNYRILNSENEELNTIVADESFVTEYCERNGWKYELIPEIEPENDSTHHMQQISVETQLKAVSDRQDFLEDCIAEMAGQVYS